MPTAGRDAALLAKAFALIAAGLVLIAVGVIVDPILDHLHVRG